MACQGAPLYPFLRQSPPPLMPLFREAQPAQRVADRLPDLGSAGVGPNKAGDRKAGSSSGTRPAVTLASSERPRKDSEAACKTWGRLKRGLARMV